MASSHLADGGREVIRRWLADLYGQFTDGWLTLFALDRGTGQRRVVWRPVAELDALAADAGALGGHCVWFGVASRREKVEGRGGAEVCQRLPGLWVDLDVAGPNHKGSQPLPTTTEEALELLRAFPLEPTAIVATGGGLQAWWLFPEPLEVDDGTAVLLARWGHTWAEHGRVRGWHVDNVFDLARIMRLPGTVNHKTEPTEVRIVSADFERRYNPDDLDSYTVELPAGPPQPAERVPYIGPQRPGDAFNAARTGSDVLVLAGFQFARRDAQGEHWTGPWKDVRQGSSATVYPDGHTTVWSDSALDRWPAVELRRPYDPFGLYCALFHAGDWIEATRALAAAGYGEQNMQRDDFSWAALDAPAASLSVEDWPDPLPLRSTTAVAEYPIDVLPAWMRGYCESLAVEMQVPVDLCAQVALGAWAAVCSGRAKIVIAGRWTEHLNLFLAAVMPSGGGKSPVSKRLTAPLRALESELAEQYRRLIAEAKAEREVVERDYAKAKKDGDRERMAMLDLELATLEVPALPRLVVDDVTQEMLAVLLHRHGGRMALISTEATMFDMACGLYSSATKKTNNNVYLQGWSADALVIDRKGSSGGEGTEIRIPEPVLTVAITVQPSTIAELARHPELAGRGFTARFMYAAPPSMLGRRDRWRILSSSDEEAAKTYLETFLGFARRFVTWENPATLRTTDEAARRFVGWLADMEPLLGEGGELDAVSEWTAKLHASVARVAGLLHLADGRPAGELVDVATVERAIRLGEYWTAHALAIAELWTADDITLLARTVVEERFVGAGVTEFHGSDINRSWHRARVERIAGDRAVEPSDVTYEVLNRLTDYDYIRSADGAPVQRPGNRKPRQRFVVNPKVRTGASALADSKQSDGYRAYSRGFSLDREITTNTLSPSFSLSPSGNPRANTRDSEAAHGRPSGWLFADPSDPEGAA